MTNAYLRKRAAAVRLRLKATLRSDDTPEQRAENVLAMMGAAWEPADRALVKEGIAEVLRDYMLLDRVARGARIPDSAYDAARDSYGSWEAAVGAIRRGREDG